MQWRARRVLRVPTSSAAAASAAAACLQPQPTSDDAFLATTCSTRFDLNDSGIISDSAQEGFTASYFFRFLQWIGTSIKIPSKIVLKNITFLQSLPIGFGELKKLRHLDLSGCTNLTQLPYSFSELMHVQYLVLRNCSQLSIPMDFLGNMSSLEYVDFNGCRKLKYLPTGIENQKYLRYLNLLSTDLKWPVNLKLPEKLQRLRIGNFTESAESAESSEIKLITTDFTESAESAEINLKLLEKLHCSYGRGQSYFPQREHLQETKLRQCLGDLRRLKELKELVLLDLDGAERILWEEIAGPDMKVLVIRDCPISIFRFKKKGTMQIGTVLRDFTLSGTLITEICIPESVLPSLETLDLSGNRQLMQVKNLPSTLLRLNLQGCRLLDTLINLSNLVNLKLLKVNLCHRLKTLNVEGLTSLEEIQAEACWELKSIQGLSQRERLKSLSISTNTDAIWNDICNFLASTSHENLSTAFFSGTVGKSSTFRRRDRAFYEMVGKFNLKVVDVIYLASLDVIYLASPSEYEFQTKMEEFQSYGAMFMCFLTFPSYPRYHWENYFLFRFEVSNDEGPAEEYKFVAGYSMGVEQNLHLHVFMWTEESNLLRDYKGCTKIGVSCNLKPGEVKRGWIMMVDKNTQVSQVCREIIIALS